jgi:hypothetical protein
LPQVARSFPRPTWTIPSFGTGPHPNPSCIWSPACYCTGGPPIDSEQGLRYIRARASRASYLSGVLTPSDSLYS